MAGMRKWIRAKLDSKPKGKETQRQSVAHEQPTQQESLPFLPTNRSHHLTPKPSHEDRHSDASPLLQNYGLFGRLPLEVRRLILFEAFGGRTLHMDLSYGHPRTRNPRNAGSPGSSMNAPAYRHCDLGSQLLPDTGRPQGWQWFSCVCHRRAGYSAIEVEQRYAAMQMSMSIEPCDDECLEGSESMCICTNQPNSDGAGCFVGVMGWLLACRQAYTDSVGILYSANTFHISSLELQLNIPRLLPSHHLESITSLELLWTLNTILPNKAKLKDHVKPLWDNASSINNRGDSPLYVLCDMIPDTFPHLRSLYISFQCWLDPGSLRGGSGSDAISEVETIFLGPVEAMMRAYLGRSEERPGRAGIELNVAIQRGAWRVLLYKYHKQLGAKLKVESVDELSRGRFWKPLASGSGLGDKEDDGLGYWICGGWEDMKTFGHDYWVMTNWGDKWTGTKDTF